MSDTKLTDSPKKILITGGTGLVGQQLSQLLTASGYTVTHLSRNPSQKKYPTFHWDIKKQEIDSEAITSAYAIIHLAGAGVADKRWSDERKKEIRDSRVYSTRLLANKVKELNSDLKHFITASAIGYYGWDTGSEWVDEQSAKGEGFLADVVEDWEAEADTFQAMNIPVAKVRIGVVLSEEGGALQEIAKPIRYGVGAPLGSGHQYMSWIHVSDLCQMFKFILDNRLHGIYNGVAPHPETNTTFTKEVASQLGKPLWLPHVPRFALRLLVGEMADMLLGGNKVSSKKMEKEGFNFAFPSLPSALDDLL